jgi:hypothetical protein
MAIRVASATVNVEEALTLIDQLIGVTIPQACLIRTSDSSISCHLGTRTRVSMQKKKRNSQYNG